jgi:hypothetical protein
VSVADCVLDFNCRDKYACTKESCVAGQCGIPDSTQCRCDEVDVKTDGEFNVLDLVGIVTGNCDAGNCDVNSDSRVDILDYRKLINN